MEAEAAATSELYVVEDDHANPGPKSDMCQESAAGPVGSREDGESPRPDERTEEANYWDIGVHYARGDDVSGGTDGGGVDGNEATLESRVTAVRMRSLCTDVVEKRS